jgi:hypothetical protein
MKQENKALILSFRNVSQHASWQELQYFEDILAEELRADILSPGLSSYTYKIARFIDARTRINPCKSLSIPTYLKSSVKDYKVIFCNIASSNMFAFLDTVKHHSRLSIVYLMDAWEQSLPNILRELDRYRIDIVLCAYLQSYEYFKKKRSNVFWVPLGFAGEVFRDYGLRKDVAVYQMGRKNARLHQFFLHYTTNYLCEKEVGRYLFDSLTELARTINRTMFFSVSPPDMSNSSRTGAISPVTCRYYEGAGSRSMLVGFRPRSEEFDLLFPFDEALLEFRSESQFKEKLDFYSKNPREYEKRVYKVYDWVHRKHTWRQRAKCIKELLENEPCARDEVLFTRGVCNKPKSQVLYESGRESSSFH